MLSAKRQPFCLGLNVLSMKLYQTCNKQDHYQDMHTTQLKCTIET